MYFSQGAGYFEGLLYTYLHDAKYSMETLRKTLLESSLSKSILSVPWLRIRNSEARSDKSKLNLSTTEEYHPPPHFLLPLPCLPLEIAKALGLSQ